MAVFPLFTSVNLQNGGYYTYHLLQ